MSLSRTFFKVFLISALGVALMGCRNKDKNLSEELVSDQNPEKEIRIEDLEGNEIHLEDYKGKIVVLNFWATWCKPCISEMPSLDRLINKLDKEHFIFLAASDENLDKIKRFAEQNPHDFSYVHLKSNVYSLGLSVLPTTYIINKEGEIEETIIGAREWDSNESIDRLNSLKSQ